MSDDIKKPKGFKKSPEELRAKLRLIQQEKIATSPKEEKQVVADLTARNFWNTCPLKLEYLPTATCSTGEKSVKSPDTAGCEWSVNSKEDHYCFWKWVQSQSSPDGQMREFMQGEISELLGASSTKVHSTLKEGFKKLKKNKGLEVLLEIFRAKQNGESVNSGQMNDLLSKMLDTESSED